MKGIICYYSGSGNTKLAIEYLAKKIKATNFELFDITKGNIPNIQKYSIVGFATWADYGGAPQLMYNFINKIAKQKEKPAFLFNTFGFISGKIITDLAELVTYKGFSVISGFSLHTPENFPPLRKLRMTFDNYPKLSEIKTFDTYIETLNSQMEAISSGKKPRIVKLYSSLIDSIFPKKPRTSAKKDFGIQNVNADLCTECGICKEKCPYNAITLDPKPIFNHDLCFGCWACYNHCPTKAIYTPKFKGKYQYSKPSSSFLKKLS